MHPPHRHCHSTSANTVFNLVTAEGEKQISKEDAAKLAAEVHSSEVNALCDDIGRQCGSQVLT
jgi:hypothetical protein